MLKANKWARLHVGAVRAVGVGPEPLNTTEWNWTQQLNVGPCSYQGLNNVTGDSWSKIGGYSGNSIWLNVKHLESKYAMETMIAIIDFALTVLFYSIIVWIIFTWIGSRMLERQFAERVVRDLDQERLIPLTVEVDQNQ